MTKSQDRGRSTFVHILDEDPLFDIDEISLLPLFGLPILRFSNGPFFAGFWVKPSSVSRVMGLLCAFMMVFRGGFLLAYNEAIFRPSIMGYFSHWRYESCFFHRGSMLLCREPLRRWCSGRRGRTVLNPTVNISSCTVICGHPPQ